MYSNDNKMINIKKQKLCNNIKEFISNFKLKEPSMWYSNYLKCEVFIEYRYDEEIKIKQNIPIYRILEELTIKHNGKYDKRNDIPELSWDTFYEVGGLFDDLETLYLFINELMNIKLNKDLVEIGVIICQPLMLFNMKTYYYGDGNGYKINFNENKCYKSSYDTNHIWIEVE
tara:strand:+ start:65 stop:580 length:516 start_codon:yes stop_codon:yes gene_type:complete